MRIRSTFQKGLTLLFFFSVLSAFVLFKSDYSEEHYREESYFVKDESESMIIGLQYEDSIAPEDKYHLQSLAEQCPEEVFSKISKLDSSGFDFIFERFKKKEYDTEKLTISSSKVIILSPNLSAKDDFEADIDSILKSRFYLNTFVPDSLETIRMLSSKSGRVFHSHQLQPPSVADSSLRFSNAKSSEQLYFLSLEK